MPLQIKCQFSASHVYKTELGNLNFKILTVLDRGQGLLNVRIKKNKIKGGFIETHTHTPKHIQKQLSPKLRDFFLMAITSSQIIRFR